MQIKKLFPPMTEQWKAVYEKERPNLTPNAITGEELSRYVRDRFDSDPTEDEALILAVRDLLEQDVLLQRKKKDGRLQPEVYRLEDGTVIGIDLLSGCFIVQDNELLRDEMTYVKGLDTFDLENMYLTIDWLRCRNLHAEKEKKARETFFTAIEDETGKAAFDAVSAAGRTPGTYAAYLRGKRCRTKAGFFREISAAMQFPSYFGENWDALSECLCDLNEWLSFKAVTVVIDDYDRLFGSGQKAAKDRETIRSIFEDTAVFWAVRDVAFRVIAISRSEAQR